MPARETTVVALAAHGLRGQAVAPARATNLTVTVRRAAPRDAAADRRLGLELLEEAFDLAAAAPRWFSHEVPATAAIALQRVAPDRAWQRVGELRDPAQRDFVMEAMLREAAEAGPERAALVYHHSSRIVDERLRANAAVELAVVLQATHPEAAEQLLDDALATRQPRTPQSLDLPFTTRLVAALWQAGRDHEAGKCLAAMKTAVPELMAPSQSTFFELLGWYWAPWPDARAALLVDAVDEPTALLCEITALRREAATDPLTAASLLLQAVPNLDKAAFNGWSSGVREWKLVASAIDAACLDIGTAAMLADEAAGRALVERMPPDRGVEVLARVAAGTDDAAQVLALLDEAEGILLHGRPPVQAGDADPYMDPLGSRAGTAYDYKMARLQRARHRLGQPLPEYSPALGLRFLDPRAAFYRASFDPNGAWLMCQQTATGRFADGRPWNDAAMLPRLLAALCPAAPERAVELARAGVPQDRKSDFTNAAAIKALAVVGLWLATPPAEREEMAYEALFYDPPRGPRAPPAAW